MGVRSRVVLLLLFLYVFSATSGAQEYRTNLELIESIKDVPISSDIYSEVANIKNLAILFLSLEEGDMKDPDYNKFADSVKKFLEQFNTAFERSRHGQPSDHKVSVRQAIDLIGETIYLERLSGTSRKLDDPIVVEIVDKKKDSLHRFLEDEARYFEDLIEKEEASPIRIEYQEYIALAYQGSENAEKHDLARMKLEEMTLKLDRNMEMASNFSNQADEMKRTLKNEDQRLFDLFSSYIQSKEVVRNYSIALEIYHNEGISDKTLPRLPERYARDYTELKSKYRDGRELSSSILKTLFLSLLKIVVPLVIALIIFMIGFRDWQRDFTDTKLNALIRRE